MHGRHGGRARRLRVESQPSLPRLLPVTLRAGLVAALLRLSGGFGPLATGFGLAAFANCLVLTGLVLAGLDLDATAFVLFGLADGFALEAVADRITGLPRLAYLTRLPPCVAATAR